MPIYDLYRTRTGALLRSKFFATAPSSLSAPGKGVTWQLQNKPTPGDYETVTWDDETHDWVASGKDLAGKKEEKLAKIAAKAAALIAAGFTYEIPGSGDPHTYQIRDVDQINIASVMAEFNAGETGCHGGYWRDIDNNNVTMSDAQWAAFAKAAKAYKMGILRNAALLNDDVSAAASNSDWVKVNVTTGVTTDGTAAGWPSNG